MRGPPSNGKVRTAFLGNSQREADYLFFSCVVVDKGYKWRKVFPMVHEEAIINADSYAYFGEISFLTGHKLSEVPAERQAGVIVQV